MQGRMPIFRRSVWTAALGLAVAAGLSQPGRSLGQPTPPAGQPPTLPGTTVQGTPGTTPGTNPLPPSNFNGPPGPPGMGTGEGTAPGAAPVSAGGLFANVPSTGYKANDATSATKIDVPILDIPATVDVVPNALFNDQQAFRIRDTLRDIPSAATLGDPRRPDAITLRGFEVTSHSYRWNGFADPSFAPRDLANVQRLEILKGPASILYGAGQPSGVVNLITKKPQADGLINFGFEFGNFGFLRPTVDAGGSMNDEGTLLFRINAAYQHTDSFRDFGFDERSFVAPAVTWVIDPDTALTFEGSYLNDRQRFDTGVTALNGVIDPIPISRSLNEPTDLNRYLDYKTALTLTHRFEGDWTGRIGAFATWYENPGTANAPVINLGVPLQPGTPPLAAPGTVGRELEAIPDNKEQYYSIISDLGGTLCTGPIQHKILFGTELGYYTTHFTAQTSDPLQPIPTPFGVFPFPSDPININAPVYGNPPPPLVGGAFAATQQQRYGFYAEDLADWNDTIKLLVGLRGDIVDTAFQRNLSAPFGGRDLGFGPVATDTTDYRMTPRVGLVYQPVKDVLSLYTTYSLSFDPPTGGIFRNPTPLRPETGRIIEGGVKADLLDKRLSLTGAWYYIVKQNVVTQDNFFFATQVGEQRSQGVEFNAVGHLTDELSVAANYAYTDSFIAADADPTLVGKHFRDVPFNQVNVWTRYDFVHTKCETIGAGLGVVLMDGRPGDLPNTFKLPGFTRWDAGLFYTRGPWNASCYFENLFDRHYYAGSVDQFTVYPGEPFTFRCQVGVNF